MWRLTARLRRKTHAAEPDIVQQYPAATSNTRCHAHQVQKGPRMLVVCIDKTELQLIAPADNSFRSFPANQIRRSPLSILQSFGRDMETISVQLQSAI
jgi:hypothetical protein